MPITSAQEATLSTRMSAKYKQDTKVPLLINTQDGRLMPNSVNVRDLQEYRPYTGNPKASLEERMLYISSSINGSRSRVVDSSAAAPEFDVGKASKDELITFAFAEFAVVLNESTDIRTLRKQVMEAAERAAGRDLS